MGWRLTAWEREGGNLRHNRTPTHTAISARDSSETTPTAPSKALRSQSLALIAIGYHDMLCTAFTACSAAFSSTKSRLVCWHWRNSNVCIIGLYMLFLFLTYSLDLTVSECHFCWPDWQETRVLSHWSDTNASSETTPTAPSKALRFQSRALIASGYHNMLRAASTVCSAAFSST